MTLSGRSWIANAAAVILVLSILTALSFLFISLEPRIGRGFLIPWVANRFLLDGKSPYSEEASQKIEELAYHQSELAEERELRFVMPLYSSIAIIPFSLIPDFNISRALWLSVSTILLFLSSFLLLRLLEINQSDKIFFFSLLSFSCLWYFSLFPLVNGHVVVLVYFFLIFAIFLLKNNYDEIAAIFLALSFIKPHLMLLTALLIILWVISQRKWHFLIWFFSFFTILITISFIILPDWLIQYLRELYRYAIYNRITFTSPTLLEGNLFSRVTPFLALSVGILILFEWMFSLKSDFNRLLWVISLTLCVSLWLTPKSSPGNYIFLTLPLLLFFSTLQKRLPENKQYINFIIIALLFLYIWGGAIYPFYINNRNISDAWFTAHQQWFSLLILIVIMLYWIRWWIISRRYLRLEDWQKDIKKSSRR